jgi:hypothetical protein
LPEDRVDWKAFFKARLKSLRDAGLSGPLASKVANAEVKAIAAVEDLFTVFDELSDAGRPDMAGTLWAEFYASLLLDMPKEDRRKFLKVVLKMADEMEKFLEEIEAEEEGSR